MGVDPRAEAIHSNLPKSNRTRGFSEVIHTGNNKSRSTIGNVFNKLG